MGPESQLAPPEAAVAALQLAARPRLSTTWLSVPLTLHPGTKAAREDLTPGERAKPRG